eukprot:gene45676-61859_t
MPNHHITMPVLIGEIQADGQFTIVQQTPAVVGDEWSDYLPDSKDLISDWRKPMNCGNFNVATGKCGGKAQLIQRRHGVALIGRACPGVSGQRGGKPMYRAISIIAFVFCLTMSLLASVAAAQEDDQIHTLVNALGVGGFPEREAAIKALAASKDPQVSKIL